MSIFLLSQNMMLLLKEGRAFSPALQVKQKKYTMVKWMLPLKMKFQPYKG